MYSGQDGNNVAGTGGTGTIGGVPQGPIVSGNGGFTGGQGMVPNQPMTSGGDIILDNSGDKKSKKGLKWVIGIIVGVLILAGVGVGVWFGISRNDGVVVENLTERELFNGYANYLLNANESIEDLSTDDIDGRFYFEKEHISGDERKAYLSKLNEKFNRFVDVYYAQPDAVDLDGLLSYGYYFAGLSLPSEEEILEWYTESGVDMTKKELNNRYKTDFEDAVTSYYAGCRKKVAESFLDMLVSIDNAGCIKKGVIDESCPDLVLSDEVVERFVEFSQYAEDIRSSLQFDAHETLNLVYNDIYDINEEEVGK